VVLKTLFLPQYFSTLERLRFAQTSGPAPVGAADADFHDLTTLNLKRRRARQARLASDHISDRLLRRTSSRRSRAASTDSSFYANLPDKIKRRHLTAEEQIIVARHGQRKSVILDPADEAIYRIGRRASRILTQDDLDLAFASPAPSSSASSMDSRRSEQDGPHPDKEVADAFYDSFRWLEEDEDLDLRLFLDDYHASIREDMPLPTKQRRPSFRRHLSISKMPFGRPSISSSRPGTKDAVLTPTSPLAPSSPGHVRRKSRTLSLITPKQTVQENMAVAAIDPAAAHYQDPEARLKLRVYLASPQKFDEAIEFGFPSTEVLSARPKELDSPKKVHSRQGASVDLDDKLQTFLSDDKSSIYSDEEDGSVADPDSPKTPNLGEKPAARPLHMSTEPTYHSKVSNDYAQAPASSREMTLRMTLTRPDLRACEDQIYGWQKGCQPGRKSQSSNLRDESLTAVTYIRDGNSKDSMERHFASMDHWSTQDKGVVKRFWDKVRRGPQ
jgi:hypothetical protein